MQLVRPRGIPRIFILSRILQVLAIGLMVLASCWYGSATWESQRILFAIGGVLAAMMAVNVALAFSLGQLPEGPNALAWTLFFLGCVALVQAHPFYGWQGTQNYIPPSVAIQRWALGNSDAPVSIGKDLVASDRHVASDGVHIPCSLQSVPSAERRLALSVEPITTRAAAGNLFLAGLLVWIGSFLFSRRSQYPWLLGCTVLLGVVIASIGIVDTLVPKPNRWMDLRGNSFAVFVSKNSAGAFLNVALAAAWGFAVWTFHRVWKHHRPNRSLLGYARGDAWAAAHAFIAKLDALQIASVLAVAWIATALFVSLSRGAAISGVAAAVATVALVVPHKHRDWAMLGTLLVTLLGVGLIVFFQLDEQVTASMESLGEIDIETEASGGRLYIWNVSWRAALYFGWFGSGLGTFHFAALPFQRPTSNGWFYHAESIYWEVLVTMGFLGAIAVLAAIVGSFRLLRSIYVSRNFADFAPILIAGMFLLISQGMHSAVDFAMILPGVYVPAALLMGAALGGCPESFRVIMKLKRKKTRSRQKNSSDSMDARSSWSAGVASVALALASMFALYHCWHAATPLAVAELIEQKLQRENQLPLEDRSDHCVEMLVDYASQYGVSINECPYLLRFAAESLCLDDRIKRWNSRPLDSDPSLAWMETAPFLVRLAYDRVDEANREAWLRSIGGPARLARLRKANDYYARARAKSPLDWHSLWGNIHTSFDCSAQELVAFAPVVQRTSGHLPQLLTSTSIFFNDVLSLEDRLRLWKAALRVSPAASMGIGRLISSQVADEGVPIDIFPSDPNELYKLVREVFTKKSFPKTHQILCRRALDSLASASTNLSPSVAAMLSADLSGEVDDSSAEMMYLSQYLQYKPDDAPSWVRLIRLQIQAELWQDANKSLRKLRQSDPNHPAVSELSAKMRGRDSNR